MPTSWYLLCRKSNMKMSMYLFYTFMFFLPTISLTLAQPNIVKTLPGYPGDLPFTLETGYIGVGETEDVKLFYYFIESERDVEKDPLMLWLTGGPGCSALSGLIFEIGPLIFNLTKDFSESGKPELQQNPYSWTKVASILFVDSPVGTGFSYARTSEAYHSSDTLQSAHLYDFLRKWLIKHHKFAKNHIFISGDSYSGLIVPLVVQEILKGNEIELKAKLNLKGIVLGSPLTSRHIIMNSRYEYGNRISFLSDEIYKSATIACNGNLDNLDAKNTKCSKYVHALQQDIKPINEAHVLEHSCLKISPKPYGEHQHSNLLLQKELYTKEEFCREQHYLLIYAWANDEQVRQALHIQEGSKGYWSRCNKSLAYEMNVESIFDYHLNFSRKSLQVIVYSGDQDLTIPYVGTLQWIKQLKIPLNDDWRPWFVNGQVAGYVTEYSRVPYKLVHATIKGGGHTAPEYKPRECLAMLDRWFSSSPL